MKVKELVEAYSEHPSVREFLEKQVNSGQTISRFQGLIGSSASLSIASVFGKSDVSLLVLVPDKEEAEYLNSDLQHLCNEQDVMLLVDSFKKPFEFSELQNDNVQARAELISRLKQAKQPKIVVTYPEAISEKVIDSDRLEKNTFTVTSSQQLDLNFLADFLDDSEFEREDFVYEPGQYAIRGGIVDIFSFSNEYPYRIELDGDIVESVRSFDPETQLSVKDIGFLKIVPNIQKGSISGEKVSLFRYFDDNTIVFLKNYPDQKGYLEKQWVKLLEDSAGEGDSRQLNQDGIRDTYIPSQLLLTPNELTANIEKFSVVEYGVHIAFRARHTYNFSTVPQPSFQKNFEMILTHLQMNELNDIKNVIFSDTGKQIERLLTIIHDRQKQINIIPVYHGLSEGFLDKDLKLACYTEHQLFERYYRYRSNKRGFNKTTALTLKELQDLQPGDYVTHIDHGVGKFMGLQKMQMNGVLQEAVRIAYRDGDMLYVNVNSLHKIAKFSGKEGTEPSLHKLGSGVWEKQKATTKKKVKDIARELIKLYAKRKAQPGFAFSPDTYLQVELEASFLYEDTPDQAKATEEIKKDMENPRPMDRLLCGDVGFGKTEVAIRAAFKAVADSKQVAVLVPTTILAHQHYRTFRERLKGLPVNVDYINRFKSAKEQKDTIKRLEEGKVDIMIGTHRLAGKDIKFKDVGLLIIDEEQKFGVAVKDRLKELRVNIDTLTLTATPIPRTLHFSLMGARDLSVINTPPPNRYPVRTELHVFNKELLKEAVEYEVNRGGQVFFVNHRIKDLYEYQALLERLCPGVRVCVAHGQMEGDVLENTMVRFIEGDYDVLIATTIIEAGLDIPNCNTIIINNAHMFGLSDLHQMRGRVGRSNRKAYCYLLSPPLNVLTPDAKKRLSTIEEFSDLGGGFNVAMRDLDIRGAGNLLGGEQSGFINDIGFDMYHKILDEAIRELKHDEFSELFEGQGENIAARDCQVDTDMDMLIPADYVSNTAERLALYTQLSNIENDSQLQQYAAALQDRFGPLPDAVHTLLESVKLKWMGKRMGFEKITLSATASVDRSPAASLIRQGRQADTDRLQVQSEMKLYFPQDENAGFYESEIFVRLLQFINTQPNKFEMKQTSKALILRIKSVGSIDEAVAVLQHFETEVYGRSEA